jgi:hypothetical protein
MHQKAVAVLVATVTHAAMAVPVDAKAGRDVANRVRVAEKAAPVAAKEPRLAPKVLRRVTGPHVPSAQSDHRGLRSTETVRRRTRANEPLALLALIDRPEEHGHRGRNVRPVPSNLR